VEFVHECLFCGLSRPSPAPAIVAPVCPGCGCVLVSSRAHEHEEMELPSLERAGSLPPALSALVKAVAAAALMVAAAKAGLDAGGPWIAGVGFSAAGLFAVPALVPAD
jgi:hypothetical protein